jgi:endonuclease/exonuclease/phosphatase (EEP) superfamily protein YafD
MRRMFSITRTAFILLAFTVACEISFADEPSTQDSGLRVLSWNVSSNAFVRQPDDFRALLRWASADILLLDEVRPVADAGKLQTVLSGLQTEQASAWNIDYGTSGGRQRGVIASRLPLESLPEFSENIPYPEDAMAYILEAMSAAERANSELSMDHGIPVNGAVVLAGDRRLLVVVADLQCCGKDRASWQEYRRRAESREIRRVIRQVLERTEVDGVIFAGDFNLVNSTFPLAILAGPIPSPHSGLLAAEVYHLDGTTAWTWDGRRTPFPSGTLDYQLYGPSSLYVRESVIVDTEDMTPGELERFGLQLESSRQLSRHRPVLVEYGWN